jgi:hypothetical protein
MLRSADALPQNRLVAILRDVEQIEDQFKARQRVSGASGQLGYLVQSANAWDITQTVTDPVAAVASFEITYTANGTQKFPIVMPTVDLRVNGTGNANRLSYLYGSGFNGALGYISGPNSLLMGELTRRHAYLADPLVSKWAFNFVFSGTITYYLKALIQASSDGVVTVVRTA